MTMKILENCHMKTSVTHYRLVFLVAITPFLVGCVNGSPVSPPSANNFEKKMLENIDTSVNPCQDFYQYACGGFLEKSLADNNASVSGESIDSVQQSDIFLKEILEMNNSPSDSTPLKIARDLFATCMDTENVYKTGLKSLTDYLATFGGWPITIDNWAESSFDWKKVVASSKEIYDDNTLIAVDVLPHPTDETINAIHIDQGDINLLRSTMMDLPQNLDDRLAYSEYIAGSAKAIRDSLKSQVTDAQIQSDIEAMVEFEVELAKIIASEEELQNRNRVKHPLSISELQQWTDSVGAKTPQGKINWLNHLNIYSAKANVKILESDTVMVFEKDFLKSLVTLLDKTAPRTLANYVLWSLVSSVKEDTNKQLADVAFEYQTYFNFSTESSSRVKHCLSNIKPNFGFALSSEYSKKMLDEEVLSELKSTVINLKQVFKSMVDDATWMDNANKATAKEKVDAMIDFIGYPEWIKDTKAIEEYYNGIKPATSNHFQNVQDINAFMNQRSWKTLREKRNRNEWRASPIESAGMYKPTSNSLVLTMDVLQKPRFTKGELAAINYGSIGSAIGHKIIHSVDDIGRYFDKSGNSAKWWTEQTLTNYQEKTKCFAEQYSNYLELNELTELDEFNVLHSNVENIADDGGLRESLKAYRQHVLTKGDETAKILKMTPEQTFFLAYASNFCEEYTEDDVEGDTMTALQIPSPFRVNGPLSNNEDFIKAFNCAADTPMNRANKCALW